MLVAIWVVGVAIVSCDNSPRQWLCQADLSDGGCSYIVVPRCSDRVEGMCYWPGFKYVQDAGSCDSLGVAGCL